MAQGRMLRSKAAVAGSQRRWWAAPVTFMAAMLAAPAGANIDIPDDPLTTAARVAPNIMFILDDSGSMAFDYMPDSVPKTSTVDVSDYAYTRNSLAYNPAVTYQAWVRANGTRMTGGTEYSKVYGSFNLVGGNTIDLGDSSSCRRFNYNTDATTDDYGTGSSGSGQRVCGGVQTFYVPKDTSETGTYLNDGRNYYRYEILAGGSGIRRSQYGTRSSSAVLVDGSNPYNGTVDDEDSETHWTAAIPVGHRLVVTIENRSNRTNRRLDYDVRNPSGNSECSGRLNGGSSVNCPMDEASGQYRIRVTATSDNDTPYRISASSSNSCDSSTSGAGWIDCRSVLPNAARNLEQELTNYATWFSYHRTRMKAAKAGASEAFSPLDSKVRVGFRTIWDRSGSRFDIPVNDGNEGRFVDNVADPSVDGSTSTTTRSTWYSRLHGVIGHNGTPLHSGLAAVGEYFKDSKGSGPYGPQTGANQYSCRQNFAILTTDGYWNNVSGNVGNQDNDSGKKITGPNNQSYTYTPSAPYRDGYSNTLADVAMKYWKEDLRTDMANNVPTTAANPAFWQHMVTFGISIGLRGNKTWTSVAEVPSNATWADPTDKEDADRIDDLLHAAVNSRGAFVAASNPSEFTEGLGAALSAIAQRTSSYSNVATNSVSVDSGTRSFNASYVSGVWTGTVTARSISTGAEAWKASVPDFSSRQNRVFTFSGTAGARFPTLAQTAALARTGGPANYAVSGEDNAKYIMGDASLEERNGSGKLRNRLGRLGDIVHSSPAYVRDTDTLYVGANDGMLHAFNAANGVEMFAYVPNIVSFTSLADLSRPDYAHKYFVDGPVTVSDRTLTPGKNILVGTLGRGGKGLYALDVTSPSSFGGSNVKWERASTAGQNTPNHMGLVLGRPVISRVATDKTAVIVANGINSASGRAVLIVLDLDNGGIIRQIDTGVGSTSSPNGLSTPTAVYGPDGRTVAHVYAGDMQGNVWKFDLTSSSASQWSATKLFTASDANGVAQPITAGVAVAMNPRTFQRWIFFGTGRYMTIEDASADNATPQSMYGFAEPTGTLLQRADLKKRTFVAITAERRGFEANQPLPASAKGWYIDLPGTGERIVQDAQVASGYLITASMMPIGNACEADGTGFINALDAFTGTSSSMSYFDLDGDGSTGDETVGGVPVGSYNPGIGMPTLSNLLRGRLLTGGSGGGEVTEVATIRPRWDRVSWREIRGE